MMPRQTRLYAKLVPGDLTELRSIVNGVVRFSRVIGQPEPEWLAYVHGTESRTFMDSNAVVAEIIRLTNTSRRSVLFGTGHISQPLKAWFSVERGMVSTLEFIHSADLSDRLAADPNATEHFRNLATDFLLSSDVQRLRATYHHGGYGLVTFPEPLADGSEVTDYSWLTGLSPLAVSLCGGAGVIAAALSPWFDVVETPHGTIIAFTGPVVEYAHEHRRALKAVLLPVLPPYSDRSRRMYGRPRHPSYVEGLLPEDFPDIDSNP